jgi:general secretion pathway protein D
VPQFPLNAGRSLSCLSLSLALALALAVAPAFAQTAPSVSPPAAPPVVAPAAPAPVAPLAPVVADSDTVTLNFVNADIEAVVKAVADITRRNFLVDPRVKGTINIVSSRPVPRNLVYPTLLSALRMQGFAAVEADGVVKIVPEADAKQQGGPVVRGQVGRDGDRLVTQVITLRNESATQLVNVLRPLISPNNTIAAYPASNALVITDYASNLARISRIIASLDQPSGEPIVVPIRNASAVDLAQLVTRFMGDGGAAVPGGGPPDPQQRVVLLADARSNSILIRSDNAARAARVRQLIEQLDTPQRVGSNVFIVYLRNADAARVAETLRGLYAGSAAASDRGPAAFPAPGSTVTATTPPGVPTTTTMTTLGISPAVTAPLSSGPAQTAPPAFNAGGATIQADVANNALIILAPEPVYNNLRAVIDKLDLRRAQVFIEALIVEVTSDKAAEFGIQWQVLTGADRGKTGIQGIGGTNFGTRGGGTNIIDASVNLLSLGQGLNVGLINGSISIAGITISNLGLLVRALETDTRANILSTPTLLTLDNEEARIIVGQNVPFITGQYATTGQTTTPTPFQTIERRDVGIVLRVKPQITEGGTVRLQLYEEVSRVQDNSTAGPILSKRALESSVAIDDQQIVVLGGLIQDTFADNADKIPYAGDVPVFGTLFRYDSRARSKTNLLIFLKPTVIRTDSDGREITTERYDYLRGEQERLRPGERWFWNDPTYPKVPDRPAMPGAQGGDTSTLPPAPPSPR